MQYVRTYVRTYYTITETLSVSANSALSTTRRDTATFVYLRASGFQSAPLHTSAHLKRIQRNGPLIILLHFTFFFFPPLDFFSLFSWFGIVRGPLEQARKEEVLLLGFIIPDLFLLLGIFFRSK